MNRSKPKLITIFFLMLILPSASPIFSQTRIELDPKKWANELSKKNYIHDKVYTKLDSIIEYADSSHGIIFGRSHSLFIDSATVFNFLNALAAEGKSMDDHFKVEFNCLKARSIFYTNKKYNLTPLKEEVKQLLSSAMDIAYRSEDEYLIAFASLQYAQIIYQFGEVGLTVMYCKNAVDLAEKLSYPVRPQDYQFLAEMLYQVREYNDCIKYGKKAVAAWKNSPNEYKIFTTSCINTVALGYHRQKMYDSAFIYYNQALQLAKTIKDTVWMGIVSGNMAQVLYMQGKYDTAYVLLKNDYSASKKSGYYDNAANSLQWAARANLAIGNKTTALSEVREAFQLLKLWPDANYLRNAYYTTTQIFREMGDYDSAFYYNNLWSAINDSLEKVVATSSLAITKARLNDETSRYNIQQLNREEKAELLKRNFIIAAIILISIIVFLYLNRSRIKLRYREQTARAEIKAAGEQLQLFTQNIVEKTILIEKLEHQVKTNEYSIDQHQLIEELAHQTILTEDDWLKFKMLFEKTHPGFFTKLKEHVSDITQAEQRMAALTLLHLTTKQMAAILGISPNSVIKAKQRLRQRFNFETDFQVEEFLSKI
jgi:DNA-binding CsgD family transcriptional regulator